MTTLPNASASTTLSAQFSCCKFFKKKSLKSFSSFHRAKMYRYNDPAKDVRGLTNFALNKFKSTAGHRVPQPPTALENFYEHVKEKILDVVVNYLYLFTYLITHFSGRQSQSLDCLCRRNDLDCHNCPVHQSLPNSTRQ